MRSESLFLNSDNSKKGVGFGESFLLLPTRTLLCAFKSRLRIKIKLKKYQKSISPSSPNTLDKLKSKIKNIKKLITCPQQLDLFSSNENIEHNQKMTNKEKWRSL